MPRLVCVSAPKEIELLMPFMPTMADGGWQFQGWSEFSESDAMLLRLDEILQLDHSLNDLADLPLEWQAWRGSRRLEMAKGTKLDPV